jgi:hypothetical protein
MGLVKSVNVIGNDVTVDFSNDIPVSVQDRVLEVSKVMFKCLYGEESYIDKIKFSKILESNLTYAYSDFNLVS